MNNLINVSINKNDHITIKQQQQQHVQLGLINARSINNKALYIKDFMVDNKFDILAITETWLNGKDTDQRKIHEICPSGFSLKHISRKNRKGGGVAIIYRK